jgi:nucleoid-associated protein YgaU
MFTGWMPNELSPNSKDIETMLSVLENAPKPAYAEVRSASRDDSSKPANREGGVTFRNRQQEMRRSGIRYIVQEGDTVFRLATDKLKDSTRWREILAMNEDRLQDVRDLRPGMEILLPVETARQNRQMQ